MIYLLPGLDNLNLQCLRSLLIPIRSTGRVNVADLRILEEQHGVRIVVLDDWCKMAEEDARAAHYERLRQ